MLPGKIVRKILILIIQFNLINLHGQKRIATYTTLTIITVFIFLFSWLKIKYISLSELLLVLFSKTLS